MIAHDEHGDEARCPPAAGRPRRRRWRTRRRARTATAVRRDSPLARHQNASGEQPSADAEGEPERDVLQHELPPHEVLVVGAERRAEGQHGRQRQPVVHPRLEVERVAHEPRHARVGDHRGRQHRVGRRQQRADQEATPSSRGPMSAWHDERDDQRAVIGIASTSLRSGSRHAVCSISASTSSPSRNRITISATTASCCTKPERGSKLAAPPGRRRRAAKPASTNSAVSDRNERCDEPGTSAPDHQQHAEDQQRRRRSAAGAGVASEVVTRVESRPRADHGAGEVPGLAGRGRGVQRLPGRGGGHDPAAGLRQRRVRQAARAPSTTSTSTRSCISHLHADHFLDLVPYSYALTYAPRQQPVPVARAGRGPTTRRARGCTRRRARARCFRRVVGAWGNDDLIEHAFDLREYDPREALEIGPLRAPLPARAALPADVRDRARPARRRRPLHLRRRLLARRTRCVEFARDTDLLLIEATLPRPERTGLRGHLTPGEAGRARPRARAPGGS